MRFSARRKRNRINHRRMILSLTLLLVLILLIIKVSTKIFAKDNNDKTTTNNGKEINVDIDQMEDDVEIHNNVEELDEEKAIDDIDNQGSNNINEDRVKESTDYNKIFKDDIFLGDSITDSLSFYEFLEESNVIAKFGLTARKAIDTMDDIVSKDPKNIYIMFGMNDILSEEDGQEFAEDYAKLIQSIKEKLPDTNIYINSILPADPKVEEKKPLLTKKNIDIFNESLKNMAKDENIQYLDVASILESNMDLIEPDGIHVKYSFYKLWLDYIIENTK